MGDRPIPERELRARTSFARPPPQYPPRCVAAAAVFLASKHLSKDGGTQHALPAHSGGGPWFEAFKVTQAEVEDIAEQIMAMYDGKGQAGSTAGLTNGNVVANVRSRRLDECSGGRPRHQVSPSDPDCPRRNRGCRPSRACAARAARRPRRPMDTRLRRPRSKPSARTGRLARPTGRLARPQEGTEAGNVTSRPSPRRTASFLRTPNGREWGRCHSSSNRVVPAIS